MHKKCFKSTEIMRFLKETSLIADVGNEYSRVRKCELLTGRIQAFVIYSFEIHKPPHSQLASSLICNGYRACLFERPKLTSSLS